MEKSYIERAEELLAKAKKDRAGMSRDGYRDDKVLVLEEDDMNALLGAGAHAHKLNYPETSGCYHTTVFYRGHQFFISTRELFAPVVDPSMRTAEI